MKSGRFNSLRFRIAVICIGLAIIPLVIAGVIITQQSVDTLERQSLVLQREFATRVGSEVRAFLEEQEYGLILLDEVYGLGILEPKEQRAILGNMVLHQQGAYQEMALLNTEGEEQIRLSRSAVFLDKELESRAENEEFLLPATSGEVYLGSFYFDEIIREPLVTISVPLFDQRSGEIVSVLVADLRLKTVWDLLAGLQLSDGDDVYVVNQARQIIAHRNPTIVLSGTTIDLPQADGRTEGLSGTDVILARYNLEIRNQELVVIAEQSASYALQPAIRSMINLIAIICSALIIAGMFAVFATRWIVRPIEALTISALTISRGDFTGQMTVSGPDEVKQLASTFNQMVNDLRTTTTSINNLNIEITERERAEQEIAEKNRALEEANIQLREVDRLKSNFLSSISHELRTPLNSIIGFTSLILDGMTGDINEEQREQLTRVESSSNHLLSLINDVLDISKIEAGMVELALEEFPLNELVSEVVELLTPTAQMKGIELSAETDGDIRVYTDRRRFKQVLINLGGNAVKFTEQGSVRIIAGLHKKNGHIQDGSLEVHVIDTGIGIKKEDIDKLFAPFQQVDGSLTRRFEGTGLGLHHSKKILTMLGGNIWIKSRYGKGSDFGFTLPLRYRGDEDNEENTGSG